MPSQIVVIFTYRSPFGTVPEFVEDEIPFWGSAKKILIVSLAEHKEGHISLAANIDAYSVCPNISIIKRYWFLLFGLRHRWCLREFIACSIRNPKHLKNRLVSIAHHIQAVERYYRGARCFLAKQEIKPDDTVVLYNYWCGPSTHASVQIKKTLPAQRVVIVTRAHGSDLYEHAHPSCYLPFRRYLLAACDHVFPISENGVRYSTTHWKCPPEKVSIAKLGIPDHFTGRFPKRDACFQVVSCSYVSPIKRVHLIAEALSAISDIPVRWTHLGGGPGLEELRDVCARLFHGKGNLSFNLLGDLKHEDVIRAYRSENFNVLVNASVSEGIPVSMMEAHCCGIPVIGPRVGGIEEIITPGMNGKLLPHDFSVDDLKNEIISIARMESSQYAELCFSTRQSWQDRFSASRNYPQFISSIEKLCA